VRDYRHSSRYFVYQPQVTFDFYKQTKPVNMTRIFLSTVLVIIAIATTNAQITLTSANVPTANLVANMAEADSVWTAALNIGPAGTNQTWDFSSATSPYAPYPPFYVSPANTPSASSFPGCNLASTDQLSDTASYNYLKVTPTAVSLLGFKSNTDSVKYKSPLKEFIIPTAYQTTFTQKDTLSGVGGGYAITGTTTETVLVDAWGNVTTPLGSFACLRIKRNTTQNLVALGIIPLTVTSITYEWWAAGHKSPVFTYDNTTTSALGNTTSSLTATYLTDETTASTEPFQAGARLSVFPNPVYGLATLSFTTNTAGKADLLVYSLNGKLVKSERGISVSAGENIQKMDLQHLAPGNYMAMVLLNGRMVGVQKIIVE
jgi:hypothetical protein